MKKLRLLCIPPYEGMYNLMTNIAAQRSDVELSSTWATWRTAFVPFWKTGDNNIDAVISRGGTAETIRAHCSDIPACDIIPSVYDVLRTIRLAQEHVRQAGGGGLSQHHQARGYAPGHYAVRFQGAHHPQRRRMRGLSASAPGRGHSRHRGRYDLRDLRPEAGHERPSDSSGIESVEAAIDSAVEIYRHDAAVRKRADLFSDLLSFLDADIVIYTSGGQQYYSTASDLPQEIQLLLRQKVSNVIAQGSLKLIRNLGSTMLSIKGRLLQSDGEDYCVYILSQMANTAVFDKYTIRCFSADEDLQDSKPIEFYLGSSEEISAAHAACQRYAAMNAPVLIEGERGTGKDRFAHYLYSHSKFKQNSFVVIDASLLDKKGWDFLLKSDSSPLTDSGLTISFIRHEQAIPPEQQKEFRLYLKNSRVMQTNRLIFSCTEENGSVPQDELYLYLTETVHCLQLRLPPLFSAA